MSESSTEVETPDVEVIVPPTGKVMVDGHDCRVRRLKTREFLALVNVLTTGLGGALSDVTIDLSDEEGVARDLSALIVLAVPRATDEFTVFLRQIVEPVDDRHRAAVATYLLDNPDVEVMLDIFEIVASQEKDDLSVLAGKAQAMWKRVAALYTRPTTR
jgi:hypothetical protein